VHQASHDVVLEACKAFTNLSVNSRLNKSLILHEGVVETLIGVMELHSGNFQVINQCLTTIRNLAIQGTRTEGRFAALSFSHFWSF
jgi:hypothetical protein